MPDYKDLSSEESIKEIKKLVEEISICMFCTYNGDRLESRPMGTSAVDDDGTIWFLSKDDSEKNINIKADPTVELLYGKGYDKFLSLHGTAEIINDKAKIKELFSEVAKVWVPEGTDDPLLRAIKFKYIDGYYWDIKHGQLVKVAKMAAAYVTGKPMDDGIEGGLKK